MAFSTRAAAENAKGFSGAAGVASGDASSNGNTPSMAYRLPLNHQRLLRGVGRTTGDGLDGKRSPEGESAGGAERAEVMDGRRERPATWYGQSRARKGQAVLETGLSPDANVRRRGTVNPKPGKGRQYSKPASVPTRTSGDVVRSIPSPARASTTSHRSSRPARHGNHCCGVVLAVTGSRGSNWNIMS